VHDDRVYSEVLTRDGAPVAIVRADPIANSFEVSIVVAPEVRGQGVGQAALRYLDMLLPQSNLTAVVDPRNQPSLALFRACGYTTTCHRKLVVQDLQTPEPTSEKLSS
jgi:L-amino acid N-acyltransferase YncA